MLSVEAEPGSPVPDLVVSARKPSLRLRVVCLGQNLQNPRVVARLLSPGLRSLLGVYPVVTLTGPRRARVLVYDGEPVMEREGVEVVRPEGLTATLARLD